MIITLDYKSIMVAYKIKVPSVKKGLVDYGVGVAVAVFVGGEVVEVAPSVLVAALPVDVGPAPPTTIWTYTSSPKNCPAAVCMRQLPRSVPVLFGAVIGTDISNVDPAGTAAAKVWVAPPICSPPTKANLNPASQAHVPAFKTFHVFVNVWPGAMVVLSGTLTSLAKRKP